ncbi:MAG TPA: sigma-54 dependent transcriptional regulator [Usitatibacter sp.]|nr:sigma-54 dependent transcriptional regulator [Usitatibacter sp.]
MSRVMVVEDDETLADNIRTYLERAGWDVRVFGSVEEALAVLDTLRPDVIVADYLLPGKTGLDLLKEVTALDPQIKVVMTTGHGEVQLAVEAMKCGAYDYLCKPLVLAELNLLLERAMGAARMEKALSFYHSNQARGSGLAAMLGESPAMHQVKHRIRQILQTEAAVTDGMLPSVLITGETGTGKELVARALHFDGVRRDGPFVEVNCASLPANLLESELFGYERGAFTDAKERKVGLVEAAEGGTLFLDEIGEVDMSIQAKLLKLLEERSVRRLGSTRERQVNVRIISATNQDLEKMVRESRFRSDLFFRLRIITLQLPPLRERREDILPLAQHFLALHGNRYGKRNIKLGHKSECALLSHTWPGNVRELQNVLEQTVLLSAHDTIECSDLALTPVVHESVAATMGGSEGAPVMIPGSCVKLLDLERQLVKQVLEQTGWNVSKAAVELGISRDMLRTRMERHGLVRPEK